eukprot:3830307-Pyramimonas_sp.AAC.1
MVNRIGQEERVERMQHRCVPPICIASPLRPGPRRGSVVTPRALHWLVSVDYGQQPLETPGRSCRRPALGPPARIIQLSDDTQ